VAGREPELRELTLALEASRRNTSFPELLNGMAVASNEASTVDEAMQTSLDEMCCLTGWPVGSVYTRSTEDHCQLIPTHSVAPGELRALRDVPEG
jgi:hypothetical protein